MSIKSSFAILLLCCSTSVLSAIEVYQFDNTAQERQYRELIAEFRCPKCQNQNLANSDSAISTDLKCKTYEQVKLGKSKQQIRQYMIERYGDFISYNPPVRSATYFLWYFPPALLLLIILIWIIYRYRYNKTSKEFDNLVEANLLQTNQIQTKTAQAELASANNSTEYYKYNNPILFTIVFVIIAMTTALYLVLDNRQPVIQFWQSEQQLAQVADDLLTGKINQPPAWAIETPSDVQALISSMQANVQQHADDEQRWLRLADVFILMQSNDSALQAIERANRLAPDDVMISTAYAQLSYTNNGGVLTNKAKKALIRIVAKNPTQQRANILLIMSATNQGNPQQALDWAKKFKSALEKKLESKPFSQQIRQDIANLERLIQVIERNNTNPTD